MAKSEVPNVLGLPGAIPDIPAFLDALDAALDKVVADPEVAARVGRGTAGNPISIQRVPSGADAADKLIKNVGTAGDEWTKGIQRPRDSFKAAALRAAGKHKANTLAALNEDRFAKGMNKVNEDEAIATALAVGATGWQAGVNARKAKIVRVFSEIMPLIGAVSEAVDRMPQDNEGQREARMVANLKGMREVGKKRRGA